MILLFAILVITYCFVGTACSMGPIMVSPHTLQWDRETDVQVSGYYAYWRTTGTTIWSNEQRSSVVTQPATGLTVSYELLTLALANGGYEICVTARDTIGNESGPSNVVPYTVYIPNPPAGLIKK